MGVRIEGYRPEYCAGVVACLQRNYEWMGKTNAEEIELWMHSSISYQWEEDVPVEQYPYKYGMVLFSDDTVVGFLGCMYSKRYVSGTSYIYLTGTNWCIDEGYRMYLVPILKKMYATADVVGEFTPRKSVEEVLVHIFKFQYVNREKLRFSPIPFLLPHEVELRNMSVKDFSDSLLKREYLDNAVYGVKCIEIKSRDDCGYVFYQVMEYLGRWIQIVKTVNGKLFARYAHEIIWYLQRNECYGEFDNSVDVFCEIVRKARKNEWMNLECEKSFFDGGEIRHPMFDAIPVVRLMLDRGDITIQPPMDFLYSEIVMLDLR